MTLPVVFQFCLAALSFVFFKITKFLVRGLLAAYYAAAPGQAFRWKVASARLLQTPGALPMLMTTGPRWNTHAIVGAAGPVNIKGSLQMDVAAAQRSAAVWTLVVCAYPSYRTAAIMSSLQAPFPESTARISLPPGRYWMALRYYHWNDPVELPALAIDGAPAISATRVPSDVNDFYRSLAGRSNLFYRALHYYVFILLRYRRFFPAAFVSKEFVPLGNPETRFEFGALVAGESLSIRTTPQVLTSHDIYITMYNRASLPVASYHVTGAPFTTPESTANLVYLARMQKKTSAAEDLARNSIVFSVVKPDDVASARSMEFRA